MGKRALYCFVYDGDYWIKDCPKKKAFNAMFSKSREKQQ